MDILRLVFVNKKVGKLPTINTERYPLNMQVNNAGDDIYTATYNELINRFGNEPTEHE